MNVSAFRERLQYPERWDASRAPKASRIVALIERRRGRLGADRTLEIGCSTCGMTQVFRSHFGRVTAIDVDVTALMTCGPAFERVLASATALPFRHEAFDVLIANHTLEFVRGVPKALREMERVLRADGLVYLAAVNRLKFVLARLLPGRLKRAFYDLFHSGESHIGHPLAYWEWRERLRRFEVTDGTLDVLAYPDSSDPPAAIRIARRIPPAILRILAPLFPSWVFYLRKAPPTS